MINNTQGHTLHEHKTYVPKWCAHRGSPGKGGGGAPVGIHCEVDMWGQYVAGEAPPGMRGGDEGWLVKPEVAALPRSWPSSFTRRVDIPSRQLSRPVHEMLV